MEFQGRWVPRASAFASGNENSNCGLASSCPFSKLWQTGRTAHTGMERGVISSIDVTHKMKMPDNAGNSVVADHC